MLILHERSGPRSILDSFLGNKDLFFLNNAEDINLDMLRRFSPRFGHTGYQQRYFMGALADREEGRGQSLLWERCLLRAGSVLAMGTLFAEGGVSPCYRNAVC